MLTKGSHPRVGLNVVGDEEAFNAGMRADRKEIDLLPPAGGLGVDIMKVEVSPADRAFVLIFVKAGAILAALHVLHLLNEVYLAPSHEKSEREIKRLLSALPFSLVVLFCTCTLLLWEDDGGSDDAPRGAGPNLDAGRLKPESERADLGAVQGVQEGFAEAGGQRTKVNLQKAGKGGRQALMKLNFKGGVGGSVNSVEETLSSGGYNGSSEAEG